MRRSRREAEGRRRSETERIQEARNRSSPGIRVIATPTPPLAGAAQPLYSPLADPSSDFRLFVLSEGSGQDRITGKLIKSNLDHPFPYTALSYTWDNGGRTEPGPQRGPLQSAYIDIIVEGPRGRGTTRHRRRIHANLLSALWHIRDPHHPKTLWIDAISINQECVIERSHQVKLMQRIYRKAHGVISWLGYSRDDSPRFMALISRVDREDDEERRKGIALEALRSPDYKFARAYTSFFQRSYWFRTWTIQEIFSARRGNLLVQCGNSIVNWNSIVEFQGFLDGECKSMTSQHLWARRGATTKARLHTLMTNASRFVDLSRLRASQFNAAFNQNRTLEKLLLENWDAGATDPKDKVFALFSMASDQEQFNIEVDYDLSVQEIYTSVIKQQIEIHDSLSIILPRRPTRPEHHLPSWCPDWSFEVPASKLGNWKDIHPFEVSSESSAYCAAGYGSRARARVLNNSLFAKGFLLDTIRRTSENARTPVIEEVEVKKPSFWKQLFCISGDTERRVVTRTPNSFDLWYAIHRRTLRVQFNELWTRVHRREEPTREQQGFREYCRKKHEDFFWILHRATNEFADDGELETQEEETLEDLRRWRHRRDLPERNLDSSRRISDAMTPRLRDAARGYGKIEINEKYTTFISTINDGLMGLAPAGTRENDIVCILHGCDFPVVLRRDRHHRRECYKLIGACYIAGMMRGEALGVIIDRGVRELEFEIV